MVQQTAFILCISHSHLFFKGKSIFSVSWVTYVYICPTETESKKISKQYKRLEAIKKRGETEGGCHCVI